MSKDKIDDVIDKVVTDEPKEVVVNEYNQDVAVVVENNDNSVTVNVAKKDDVILDPVAGEMTKSEKIASIVWTVINVVTNIAFLFFLSEVLRGFSFVNGINYTFDTFRIIGIVIFVLAQFSGVVLFVKFFSRQQIRTKLILATMPLTLIMLVGGWAILNIDNFQGESEVAIKETLNLQNFDPSIIDLKYVIIAGVVYLALLYIIYGWIVKSTKKKMAKQTQTSDEK